MSRISTSQVYGINQQNILNARAKELKTSDKASSLKAIDRPSDNPADFVIAANMKDDVSVRESISKNAHFANSVLSATETVLTQSQDISQKMHELALSVSGGKMNVSENQQKAVLAEMEGLYENFIGNLNTRFGNKTLLSGFQSDKPAFDMQGNYLGDSGSIKVEVDRGVIVPMNISGTKIILGQGLEEGVNMPQVFQNAIAALRQGDTDGLRACLHDINKVTDQLSLGRTQIAGYMTQINRAIESSASTNIETQSAVSKIEDADAVKVFSDLARDQTVLKAAIDTSHKILSETSLDTLFR